MSQNNNNKTKRRYEGGACLVCEVDNEFEDGRDGFYYCTCCRSKITSDGMYTGTFTEGGTYKCIIEYVLPPPVWSCSECAGTDYGYEHKVDGNSDGNAFYYCLACHTKILDVVNNSCQTFDVYVSEPQPQFCLTCEKPMFGDGLELELDCDDCQIQEVADIRL